MNREAIAVTRFNEEVKHKNIRAIQKAGEKMLENDNIPMNGQLRERFISRDLEHELRVTNARFIPSSNGLFPTLTSSIEILVDNALSVSQRDLEFLDREGGSVLILSHSLTEDGYESRGYGQSLFRFGHKLTWRLIDSELFEGKSVYSEVVDDAHEMGLGVQRKGWTGHFATSLGYQRCGKDSRNLDVYRFVYRD